MKNAIGCHHNSWIPGCSNLQIRQYVKTLPSRKLSNRRWTRTVDITASHSKCWLLQRHYPLVLEGPLQTGTQWNLWRLSCSFCCRQATGKVIPQAGDEWMQAHKQLPIGCPNHSTPVEQVFDHLGNMHVSHCHLQALPAYFWVKSILKCIEVSNIPTLLGMMWLYMLIRINDQRHTFVPVAVLKRGQWTKKDENCRTQTRQLDYPKGQTKCNQVR